MTTANPTRLNFKAHCGYKQQFTSKSKAEAAIRSLQKRGLASNTSRRGPLQAYACVYGPHWHIGHRGKP